MKFNVIKIIIQVTVSVYDQDEAGTQMDKVHDQSTKIVHGKTLTKK